MVKRIGLVCLGHSSVSDAIPGVKAGLSNPVEVVSCGALDGLGDAEISALAPKEGDHMLALKAEPGVMAKVAYHLLFPRVQECVRRLELQRAEIIAVLCGADWDTLKSSAVLINPGAVMPHLAVALSNGKKLGVVFPAAEQVTNGVEKYRRLGANAVATHITMYGEGGASEQTCAAAQYFREQGVDIIYMPCMGMTGDQQKALRSLVGCPVLLAHSVLARILDEMVGDQG
jgi:uncharacterized protein YlzI (FlbEa/FlbD family)